MKKLNRNSADSPVLLTEKILQFGGGNFLRGFVDWIIDVYNEKTNSNLGVIVVKPTERGDYEEWREQEGLFHVLTKGIKNGKLVDESHLVKCISRIIHPYKNWPEFLASAENENIRCIISNTTEMGIRFSEDDKKTDMPPNEFPAKLTLWLHHRFHFFNGDKNAGCIIVPTELLIDNGLELKNTILKYADAWELENGFKKWIEKTNIFCNTLVDRIIPGVGKESLNAAWQQVGFKDEMITQGEPYHLWAIEAPNSVREELPLDKIGLNIIYTDDLAPYRKIKVRILNGAHTSMVPVGYLYGIETVQEAVEDELMGKYIRQCIYNEIIPSIDLPNEELHRYADDVLDRFKNPFIKHPLISISLNSISKFKTRVLPSILEFEKKTGQLPACLVFSLAALICFYKGEYEGRKISLNDDEQSVLFIQNLWAENTGTQQGFEIMSEKILQWNNAWECDLSEINGFKKMLSTFLTEIKEKGMVQAIRNLF